ncbi:LacI family DNA-binding transcriptional regulator [Cohnella zeiphila]|uniref:LacI family DNA-binding transcriptional regulator n=1 Tax=Cohnella zeiphila TaxID=2761120 RepID=A0A7X0SPV1_9BACL|nr:LacI family DNA-binding transcriptional regulator [Cohnella zeiphila]MBB6731658.1 LacI family DNA-binding transcriptional regulator [Cohnella zeiphila]
MKESRRSGEETARPGAPPRSAEIGIKQIAERLGLSASTVSRALNDVSGVRAETRRLVLETARKLGYVPNLGAKQLAGKGSGLVGVFFPEFESEASLGFIHLFSRIQKAFQSAGKDVLFFSVPFEKYRSHWLAECCYSRHLEGAVVFSPFDRSHPFVMEALELGLPFVNFEGTIGPRCSSLLSDDAEGGRLAGEVLAENGHRVIGYVDGPSTLRICRERYSGFCAALEKRGIRHDAGLTAEGDFSGASGAAAAEELLRRHPSLTAIACANDLMAMGAIMALNRMGIRVPERVSVVGYDNEKFGAYTSPPLTTIRHSNDEMAPLAVRLMLELLGGRHGRLEMQLPTLVKRASVAAPFDKP